MRRKVIFFNPPVISSGGGGGGELQQTVQINLGDGTWNTAIVSGWFRYCANESTPISSITNTDSTVTGWSLARPAVSGVGEGVTATSTATGYPVGVTEKLQAGASDGSYVFTSLNDSYTYEFDFFASTTRTWENAAGTSTFTIGGTSDSISHRDYYGDAITLAGISPSSGEISIDVTKGNGASNWYLSNIVVREYN